MAVDFKLADLKEEINEEEPLVQKDNSNQYCSNCGELIPLNVSCCPYCGMVFVSHEDEYEIRKWPAFFLCLFLGYFGAHKFYERRIWTGILYLFTLGLFGVGYFFDIFIILFKSNPYYVKK